MGGLGSWSERYQGTSSPRHSAAVAGCPGNSSSASAVRRLGDAASERPARGIAVKASTRILLRASYTGVTRLLVRLFCWLTQGSRTKTGLEE